MFFATNHFKTNVGGHRVDAYLAQDRVGEIDFWIRYRCGRATVKYLQGITVEGVGFTPETMRLFGTVVKGLERERLPRGILVTGGPVCGCWAEMRGISRIRCLWEARWR